MTLFFLWCFLVFLQRSVPVPSMKPNSSLQFTGADQILTKFVWAKGALVFHIFLLVTHMTPCLLQWSAFIVSWVENKQGKDVALGISRHIFLYVKQMAICYTSRSRYGKRQRSPSEKRSTEHENTHSQYRTVNYCFFCYSVFWIPTQRDTIFILNRISTTVTNDIIDLFQQTFPKMKKRSWESMSNTTQWPLVVCRFVWLFFFGSNLLTHIFFFFPSVCFSHHNIAEKSRNKIHTGSGFSKRRKKNPPWRMYINIHDHFTCDQFSDTVTMMSKKEKIFPPVSSSRLLLPLLLCSQSIAAPPTQCGGFDCGANTTFCLPTSVPDKHDTV